MPHVFVALRGTTIQLRTNTCCTHACRTRRYRLLHEYSKVFDYKVELSQWPEARPLSEVLGVDVFQQLPMKPELLPDWAP